MMLVKTIRQRLRDMSTLKDTGLLAERIAHDIGESLVGAEHWVLAAIELADGTARLAFSRVGADAHGLRPAISQQYADALRVVGIDATALTESTSAPTVSAQRTITFQAQASTNALFAQFAKDQRINNRAPFMGATVIQAAASLTKGTLPRALSAMGVDAPALSDAAGQIIAERSSDG